MRGSVSLSSFSCWHSAINCIRERCKLSSPQLTTSTWLEIHIDQAVLCPLLRILWVSYKNLSKTAMAISYELTRTSRFLSSWGMWNDHNWKQQYVTEAVEMSVLRQERHSSSRNWGCTVSEVKSKPRFRDKWEGTSATSLHSPAGSCSSLLNSYTTSVLHSGWFLVLISSGLGQIKFAEARGPAHPVKIGIRIPQLHPLVPADLLH